MIPKSVAIIWEGGGFSGAYSCGGYMAVCDFFGQSRFKGVMPFPYHYGVSIGGAQAARVVEDNGDYKRTLARWQSIEMRGSGKLFNFWKFWFRPFHHSFFNNDGLKKLISELDIEKIIESPLELNIAAINENTVKQRVFSNHDPAIKRNPEILRRAILASMAIAGIFDRVDIEGAPYSDGLYINFENALKRGCDTIIVLGNSYKSNPHSRRPNQTAIKRLLTGGHMAISRLNAIQIHHLRQAYSSSVSAAEINKILKEMLKNKNDFAENCREFESVLNGLGAVKKYLLKEVVRKMQSAAKKIMNDYEDVAEKITELIDSLEAEIAHGRGVKLVHIRPKVSVPSIWTAGFNKKNKDISRALEEGYGAGIEILNREFPET